MRLGHSACGLSVRTSSDPFLHQMPASLGQWSQTTPWQVPQAFVSVTRVKKNDALACVRVVKSCARMLRDKLTGRLPSRSIRIIKHFFAKFLEFFNADDSDRFRDGLAPFVVDCFSVLKFFEWHGTSLFASIAVSQD